MSPSRRPCHPPTTLERSSPPPPSPQTYDGHAFKFVDPRTKELVSRMEMRSDTHMYIIDPLEVSFIFSPSPS